MCDPLFDAATREQIGPRGRAGPRGAPSTGVEAMALTCWRVKVSEMRSSLIACLVCLWPATVVAQEASTSDVVVGYQSKRVHRTRPESIDIERQVIRGHAQKPHLVFTVRKVPFRFEVGTGRYSWRADERRRASQLGH